MGPLSLIVPGGRGPEAGKLRRKRPPVGWPALVMTAFLALSCSRPMPNAIILCAGDSLTEEGYPRNLSRIIRQEGFRARVLDFGRKGFNSGEYRRYLQSHRDRLASLRPDFILLQLGTNDVRLDGDATSVEDFERNMKAIIGLFREFRTRGGRIPILLLAAIPPVPEGSAFPFSPESSRRVRDEINPALKRIAEEGRLPLVDNFSLFLKSPGLLPGVHPSAEGYREMAANWYRRLKPYFQRG